MQVHVFDSIDVYHYSLAISTSLKLQIQAGKHFDHRIRTPPNLIKFGINTYWNLGKLNQNLFTNTKSSGLHAWTCSCESVRVRAQDSDSTIMVFALLWMPYKV